jgi:hypothetical protein
MVMGVNAIPRLLCTRERDLVFIVKEAGSAPEPILDRCRKYFPLQNSIPAPSYPQWVTILAVLS